MLTLKRHSIKVTDKEGDKLFVHLSLDTEPSGYLSSWDRFSKGELAIEKPWIGNVSKDLTEFKVRRTKAGVFKSRVSMFEICGRLIVNNNERTIEIKIRPVWYVALSLVWVSAFLAMITFNFFNDSVGWTICISIVVLQILFLILDLNKTDERLNDYLDQFKKPRVIQ